MRGYFVFGALCALALAANQSPPYDNPWCWEGRTCTLDTDCKQSNGQKGNCCNKVCKQNPLARGDLCGTSLTGTGCPNCDANLQCATESGTTQKCQQIKASNGCACNSTGGTGNSGCLGGLCLPSGLCGFKEVATGGPCEIATQCLTNNCTGALCQPLSSGQSCSGATATFNPCGPTQTCYKSKCADIAAAGQQCTDDFNCATGLYCTTTCVAQVARGGSCTTNNQCNSTDLCSSGTCTAYRSVAGGKACTLNDACVSKSCTANVCDSTHQVAVGGVCTGDSDCPYFASCNAAKKCTSSGLNLPCDPLLTGGDMDAQCNGSKDLYCTCSGSCQPTQTAVFPPASGGSVVDPCKDAHDAVSNFPPVFKDLTKADVSGLSASQKSSLATDTCCRDCHKDKRVSSEGFLVNCATKTVTSSQVCGAFAADPLALTNCPDPEKKQAAAGSFAASFGPVWGVMSLVALIWA